MKIAFVTTMTVQGSTVIGRVMPLAEHCAKNHKVHVLVHRLSSPYEGEVAERSEDGGVVIEEVGKDPFTRTGAGKRRLSGLALILRMKINALRAALKLINLKPDVIIIVKPLPENVFAVALATLITRPRRIILDVDDFELTANALTSVWQRAAIHASERLGARLADHIVTATPFLSDHFDQLTQGKRKITMIPTGIAAPKHMAKAGHTPSLVYAGSISQSSGHKVDMLPDILEAVRQELPETQLHIYGDGDDVEKLKRMFTEKNLDGAVKWHGRFSSPYEGEVARLGRDGGVVVIDPIDSSIVARAKSSFRVTLAGILGLPVVTSNIGIRPYLVPQSLHTKCFAKPATAADYADKVVALLENPLSDREHQTMRTHAEQFTWETLAPKYEKLWSDE